MTGHEHSPTPLPTQTSDDDSAGKIVPFRPAKRPKAPHPPPDRPTDPPPAA